MSAHVQGAAPALLTVEKSSVTKRFSLFAWLVLAYNIPVILWGAYVRVSFSGDGCGANWPFCNGQVIPQKMSVPTAIEYTHRMMTSLDSVAVIALCIWAFKIFPKKHAVRFYAVVSLGFLFLEALLGAGLVLFRLVAKNQSTGRAMYLSAHLTNTLLLLAALTATAWLASSNRNVLHLKQLSASMLGALTLTVIVSVTGAIAALGDTLFPASSLQAGMQQDFSSASSILLRLRIVHPLIAVLGAAYLLLIAAQALKRKDDAATTKAGAIVAGITIFQLAAGMVNLSLLAPLWMQLTHLFIADVLWIAVVVLALQTCVRISFQPAQALKST